MTWADGAGNKNFGNGPWGLAVARGLVGATLGLHVHGYNAAVGTAFETLWGESTLKTYPAAATAMTLSSSAAADALAGPGTGAQKVLITYLDGDWALQTLSVDLLGQSGAVVPENWRILDMKVTQSGTGLRNAGILYIGTGTITTGKPAVVHAAMVAGWNSLMGGSYTIPAGYNGYIPNMSASVGEGKTANIFLSTRDFGEDTFHPHHHQLSFQTGMVEDFYTPIALAEKTDIELQGFNDVASQEMSGVFDLILIPH